MLNVEKNRLDAVIIEDNEDSLSGLKTVLKDFQQVRLVGEAINGREAIELIRENKPDLLFLDIHLPDMDGFEVLKNVDYCPAIIFTTAFDQYAIKAFEANGIDYLLKPIKKERLGIAIHRVISLKNTANHSLMEIIKHLLKEKNKKIRFSVQKEDQILIIPQEDVYYFKSEERYTFLCTFDKNYFYNSSLKELEQSLDQELFFRINRCYIVSLDKIVKLKKDYLKRYKVVLRNPPGTSLRVSRDRVLILKEKLNNYREAKPFIGHF
jgi:DNA-binding LytR/AlgR family response regulator